VGTWSPGRAHPLSQHGCKTIMAGCLRRRHYSASSQHLKWLGKGKGARPQQATPTPFGCCRVGGCLGYVTSYLSGISKTNAVLTSL
jgi:hypothetical protein